MCGEEAGGRCRVHVSPENSEKKQWRDPEMAWQLCWGKYNTYMASLPPSFIYVYELDKTWCYTESKKESL
jgi:hypothetical protein